MTVSIIVHRKTQTVLAKIPEHRKFFKAGIQKAFHDIGKSVNRETIRLIKVGPKTGIKWPSLPNRSSKPHEAPAWQSGRLAGSNDYKVRNHYQMEVGETVFYADFLEKGTKKMGGPRPHLLKAVNNEARNTQNTLLEMVEAELKNKAF